MKLVMNTNSFEDIDVMFYNNDITAHHWTLPESDIEMLKAKKLPIAVFKAHGNYSIPAYLVNYPYLFLIDKQLENFE